MSEKPSEMLERMFAEHGIKTVDVTPGRTVMSEYEECALCNEFAQALAAEREEVERLKGLLKETREYVEFRKGAKLLTRIDAELKDGT